MLKIGLFATLLFFVSTSAFAAPEISIDETVWMLGLVENNKPYEKTVFITNRGDEPLEIKRIDECCGFFATLEGSPLILPGEKRPLRLLVQTFKMAGEMKGEMLIMSNDPRSPISSITAFVRVVPKEYALARKITPTVDIGIVDFREEVEFLIHIANDGNVPLVVKEVSASPQVIQSGQRLQVPSGQNGILSFRYRPGKIGPVNERLVLSTNDTLDSVMDFQIQGYVTEERLPGRSLIIYPVGARAELDSQGAAFRYRFSLENRSDVAVELLKVESSLPYRLGKIAQEIKPQLRGEGEILINVRPEQAPVKGYVYLTIAVPIVVE